MFRSVYRVCRDLDLCYRGKKCICYFASVPFYPAYHEIPFCPVLFLFARNNIFYPSLFFYLKLKPIKYENKEIENRKTCTGNTGKS